MHFRIYKDTAGEWRWTLIASNNLTIADSAEGYVSKRNVLRAVNKLVKEMLFLTDIPVIERLK